MTYIIKTHEKWDVYVEYHVESYQAKNLEEAIKAVRDGNISYDNYDADGFGDEFIEVVETEIDDDDDDSNGSTPRDERLTGKN